jgi:predicted dienelactone hydrolase
MKSIGIALVALVSSVLVVASTIELPAPGGPLPVGRTRWLVTDPSRTDPFNQRPRQIEIVAWYPTSAAGARGPYFTSGLDEVRSLATMFGNRTSMDALGDVRVYATDGAAPRQGDEKLPLLLFSHGYTGVPAASTTLLEDLASAGYVVLSIVHPFEASASTIDGGVVTTLDESGRLREPIQAILAEWKDEDRVLADVTSARGESDQVRLLRAYLDTLHHTTTMTRRWVDDVRAVVSRLSALPRDDTIGRVIARADTARYGVFGHSMGGVMAGEYCLTDKRCAAVLNLDGSPQYGSMIDARLARPLLMAYSARPGRLGASDAIYKRAASRYYRVDVDDTRHLDFTDMVMWPALRERHATGSIAPDRAIAATRAIVREFFDQELRSRRSKLLAGERRLDGVRVQRP